MLGLAAPGGGHRSLLRAGYRMVSGWSRLLIPVLLGGGFPVDPAVAPLVPSVPPSPWGGGFLGSWGSFSLSLYPLCSCSSYCTRVDQPCLPVDPLGRVIRVTLADCVRGASGVRRGSGRCA